MTNDKDHKEIFDKLNSIKTEDALQSEKIKQMQKNIENIDKKVDRIENKLDWFFEKADEKYAKKETVEKLNKVLWSVIGFVFASLWAGLLALVLK